MYVLMGANGTITSKLAPMLLAHTHAVRVVGRNPETLKPLQALGAQVAIGDARDADFLTAAFADANAVYTMIPTAYDACSLAASQAESGQAIAIAIARSGTRRVVNLSSIGAERAEGTGPIKGLHQQERRLDALADMSVLHLRPAYFMENHLLALHAIRATGVYASLERSDAPVPMVATKDIASIIARELLEGSSRGILHLRAARQWTFQETASLIGAQIGKPELRHRQATPEEARSDMLAGGMSPDVVRQMEEMAGWLTSTPHDPLPGPVERTPTTLEAFVAAHL